LQGTKDIIPNVSPRNNINIKYPDMSAKRDRSKGTEGSWNNIKKRKWNISYPTSFSSSINIILFQPLLAIPHFTHINYGVIRIMKNIKIHQSKMIVKPGSSKKAKKEDKEKRKPDTEQHS